jgi:peptidoglycan/LPS O-acetylase OafA/YrhL
MSHERIFGLDFLRALAVMLVLGAHVIFLFWPITHAYEIWELAGHLGVELFFVLSGFLIGGILAKLAVRPKFPLADFWKRRWLRTLPNYYLFLIIDVLLARWMEHAWPNAWPYVVFMQNFAWPQPMFFIESWSLSVEEIFYFLAPLLVMLVRPTIGRRVNPIVLVAAAIVVLTAIRCVYVWALNPGWNVPLRMVAGVRLDAIAYGVLAMLLCRRESGVSSALARSLLVAGLIGLTLSIALHMTLPRDTDFFARTGLFSLKSASLAALLPAAAAWTRSHMAPAIEAAVRSLARWSYSLYLCQLAVLRVMFGFGAGQDDSFAICLAQSVCFVVLSIIVAAITYRYFESPILELRDRWVRPEPSPAAALRGE